MDTLIGWVEIVGFCWLIARWRGRRHTDTHLLVPTSHRDVTGPRGGTTIAGLIVGHHMAHDQTGFRGDPLPNWHRDSATNVAFWASEVNDEDSREV